MFSALGLFQGLPCPEKGRCQRPNCLFSHSPEVKEIPVVCVPVDASESRTAATKTIASSSSSSEPSATPRAASSRNVATPPGSVPTKRPIGSPLRVPNGAPGEPPKKLQRVGTAARPSAVSSSSIGTVRLHDCYSFPPPMFTMIAFRMARHFCVWLQLSPKLQYLSVKYVLC